MDAMNLAYLAIMLMLLEYALFGSMVAVSRSRYKVAAPAVTGHPDFERYFRVQQNTLEQLIVVIPSLWIMALTLSPLWAALSGYLFVAGRAYYAWGYYRKAADRHWGFVIGAVATVSLACGACIGILKNLWLSMHITG
jgi:glutathione S-transferase